MSTLTDKLDLFKADPTENVDVVTQINDNYDKIDLAFSGIVGAYKNAIRNGDMGVAQRGNGPFTISNVYTVDGWQMTFVGGTFSVSRVVNPLGSGSNAQGSKYALRVVTAGQAAAGDLSAIVQKIEGVEKYAGKEVTLSFRAFSGSGTPKIGVEVVQDFGTGGAPSGAVQTAIGSVILSINDTGYSITFTVPSINGKTLGTNGNDSLVINLWLSTGSTNAARASNIGIQNSTITITDIQLEAGSVATAFERLPQQVQLAWCQRYFWQRNFPVTNSVVGLVSSYTNILSMLILENPVVMRAKPGIGISSGGHFQISSNGGSTPITGFIDPGSHTVHAVELQLNSLAVTVGGNFLRTNTAGAWINATAEL